MGEKGYQETERSVDTRRVVLAPEVIRWEKKLMRGEWMPPLSRPAWCTVTRKREEAAVRLHQRSQRQARTRV